MDANERLQAMMVYVSSSTAHLPGHNLLRELAACKGAAARQSDSSNLVLPDATASAAVPECVCIRMKQKKPSLNTLEHVRDERPHPPGQPCISRPLSWSAEATIPRVWEEFVIGLFASSTNPAATMRGWQAAKLQALRSPPPAVRVALEAKLRAAQHPGM